MRAAFQNNRFSLFYTLLRGCQPSRHKGKVGGLGIKNKKKCRHSRELIEEVSITLRREYALMKGVALSPSGKKLNKKSQKDKKQNKGKLTVCRFSSLASLELFIVIVMMIWWSNCILYRRTFAASTLLLPLYTTRQNRGDAANVPLWQSLRRSMAHLLYPAPERF